MRQEGKTLVAYFSATGTTARAAERLARMSGGNIYRIIPEQSYTTADLDWHDPHSRSSVEMKDPDSRPAIQGAVADIANYDVILIGYPVWWDAAPRIINTFIEMHDLTGKTVKVFVTSGGSGIAPILATLRKTYPGLHWDDGLLMNSPSDSQIQKWLDK